MSTEGSPFEDPTLLQDRATLKHQHRPQIAVLAHQHLQKHPREERPKQNPAVNRAKYARTITLKSTPKQNPKPPPKPPCTLPSRCKHAPAPSPACPMRPTKHLKQLPTNCVPQHHQQHPKLRSPLLPTVKMQKCAHQNSTCTSSSNCMPPSTLPSILKRCARTAISTSNSTPLSTYTSTPNRTPPRPRPSDSQITFPSCKKLEPL